jgi:hypothetical protein
MVMSSEQEGKQYVSYDDVRRWADETEKDYHCHVSFEWYPMVRKDGRKVWSMRCIAKWKGTGPEVVGELGVSHEWPCNDYKTPSGLMLRLLYDLDFKLTERAVKLAQASEGQRPLPF